MSPGPASPGPAGKGPGSGRSRANRRQPGLRTLATATVLGAVMSGCGGPTTTAHTASSTSTPATTSTVAIAPAVPTVPGPWDWPTYGHDAQHTFHGRTTLTKTTVKTLRKAWVFPTADAVTATPTVVDGVVYVGSWDDYFYAVDLETGTLRWKVRLKSQNAVKPYPGEVHRDLTSDGGLVTSSAWFEPATAGRPALVIFGGGYTLYALNAADGALYWEHDYTGRPDQPPSPDTDGTRIFSSPVVENGVVLFGVDVDGAAGYGGYVVGASLATGDPVWEYQTDVDAQGHVLDDGCGSVWSSGTVLPALGLVVFGTADCDFANAHPMAESMIALHVNDGAVAWQYKPARPDPQCDWDFGATPNAGVDAAGKALFLGEGSKDGTYYAVDPRTGGLRWKTNVVFGGFSGGFIASTAYDGKRVYGATAVGDFGRFESNSSKQLLCDPSNPRDTQSQEPTDVSFDGATGKVLWHESLSSSFAPVTVAGGLTFSGLALSKAAIDVRDGGTGRLIAQVALPQANWSGIATVGDAVVLGLGNTYNPAHNGIEVLTPGGGAPVVPTR
ncbi:MAG TPA: PQQ-binding-like beta-propeller repeat protein [Acidimicrobiales bacterium]|nr:PQQ-binding-like beta-propeller repeat protein [Acidimicrobiales bacterium]